MNKYPSLREVYTSYGVDAPKGNSGQMSDWRVPSGFGNELVDIMGSLAQQYESRPLPAFSYTGSESPPPDIELHKLILYDQPLVSDPAVHLKVFEVAGISSMTERHKKQWALWLSLKHNGNRMGEGFLLHENTPYWNFAHRLVSSEYRGVGLFNHFASALERFVESRSDHGTQVVYLTTGQPDVALAFLKRGYSGATGDDCERLEHMLHARPGLMLAPAKRPLIFRGGDIHEVIPTQHTSFYCFDRATVQDDSSNLIVENSFRVRLEKSFP